MRLNITQLALTNVVAIRSTRRGQFDAGMVVTHGLSAQRLDATSPWESYLPDGNPAQSMWQWMSDLFRGINSLQPSDLRLQRLLHRLHHTAGSLGTANATAAANTKRALTRLKSGLGKMLGDSKRLLKRDERMERSISRCSAWPRCQSSESS